MLYYKQNITNLPNYNDGFFKLFVIIHANEIYPTEYLREVKTRPLWFEELSISDRLKFEADERKKNITLKIRIPQMKNICSLHAVKIGDNYHKVFNAYHFTNKDGIKQTDLTLEGYDNPRLEEEL